MSFFLGGENIYMMTYLHLENVLLITANCDSIYYKKVIFFVLDIEMNSLHLCCLVILALDAKIKTSKWDLRYQ